MKKYTPNQLPLRLHEPTTVEYKRADLSDDQRNLLVDKLPTCWVNGWSHLADLIVETLQKDIKRKAGGHG